MKKLENDYHFFKNKYRTEKERTAETVLSLESISYEEILHCLISSRHCAELGSYQVLYGGRGGQRAAYLKYLSRRPWNALP